MSNTTPAKSTKELLVATRKLDLQYFLGTLNCSLVDTRSKTLVLVIFYVK